MNRYLILGILVVVIVVLGVGFFFHVSRGGSSENHVGTSQNSSAGMGTVQIQDSNSVQISEVHYKDGVFTPQSLSLQRKNPGDPGCLITVVNDSSDLLSIRVGPYEAGKVKGFPYPAIAPGKSGTIDPRYGTIAEISFYSVNTPAAVFLAHLQPTCLP